MVKADPEIRKWASSLPYWEQLALKKILEGNELTDDDYGELVELFLEDAEVVEKTATRHDIFGEAEGKREDEGTEKKIVINRLFDVSNVNALLDGQEIEFSPEITVLFGHNRTGKTGYFRVLACSAHQRGSRGILPDVYEPDSGGNIASAKIEISGEGGARIIELDPIEENPELDCFYVYDTLTEDIHINRDTPVEFVPRALGDLKDLSAVYDMVLGKLNNIINDKRKPNEFGALFEEDTEVGLLVRNLSPDTDLEALKKFADTDEEDTLRFDTLDKRIGTLRGLDVNETVSRLKGEIKDLEVLKGQLELINERLSEKEVRIIEELKTKAVTLEKGLREKGIKQFESSYFEHVGSEEWLSFVRTADALARKESEGRGQYPEKGDICLFCRQPLTTKAVDFINSLWRYLRTDLQIELARVIEELNSKRKGIEVVKIPVVKIPVVDFGEDSAGFRVLEIAFPEKSKELKKSLELYHDLQVGILGYMATGEKIELPVLPKSDVSNIEVLISEREKRIGKLEKGNVDAEIKELTKEYNELKDRFTLTGNFANIRDYVNDLKVANVISENMGDTKHITLQISKLSAELITNQYAKYFSKVLKKLGCDVRVKIDRKGEKGEQRKFITLDTPVDISELGCHVRDILSEGERRAVTIADFVTEAIFNKRCAGLILDDPTTGMDRNFKEKAAGLFIRLAKKKQVVIFTHDLVFLSFLYNSAKWYDRDRVTYWIKRGGERNEPGYVAKGAPPYLEDHYGNSNVAREYYALAKNHEGRARDSLLRDGFEALRTSYEILIIKDIINNVISRWDERVRYSNVKEIVGQEYILHAIYNKYDYLSGFIKGHSHSPEFSDIELTLPMLLAEINSYEEIKRDIKLWKKIQKAREPLEFKTRFPQ